MTDTEPVIVRETLKKYELFDSSQRDVLPEKLRTIVTNKFSQECVVLFVDDQEYMLYEPINKYETLNSCICHDKTARVNFVLLNYDAVELITLDDLNGPQVLSPSLSEDTTDVTSEDENSDVPSDKSVQDEDIQDKEIDSSPVARPITKINSPNRMVLRNRNKKTKMVEVHDPGDENEIQKTRAENNKLSSSDLITSSRIFDNNITYRNKKDSDKTRIKTYKSYNLDGLLARTYEQTHRTSKRNQNKSRIGRNESPDTEESSRLVITEAEIHHGTENVPKRRKIRLAAPKTNKQKIDWNEITEFQQKKIE